MEYIFTLDIKRGINIFHNFAISRSCKIQSNAFERSVSKAPALPPLSKLLFMLSS